MKLHEWLAEKQLTVAEAARQFGVHQMTLCRWINGEMPSPANVRNIRKLTGNAVGFENWERPTFAERRKTSRAKG